ncbi:unnamed protein product [Camellia sinensis]
MSASVLISAAQGILNPLIPLATEQIKLAWGFKDDLQRLEDRLKLTQAELCDAENHRGRVNLKTMQVWLKKLNSVACSADDVLDELAFEVLRRKLEVQNRFMRNNKACKFFFFCLSNPLPFRFKMANKVKNINLLLDNLKKDAEGIGLRPADQILNASTSVEPREVNFRLTIPFVDDKQVVGRDGDVSTVIDMMLGSDNTVDDLPVIAIVGMGGAGKTTLAQLVYKHDEVVKTFGEQRMWICVSDDFKVERLLNEMVECLTGNKCETQNVQGIVKKLGEKLKGKKYLLVLDDVWNENQDKWVRMRDSLLGIGGSKGSKIMATTRSMDVVSTMRTSPSLTHHLNQLSENDSWTMFRKRAFANGGPTETQKVDIGGKMVKKCKGVPLAIKTLGGLICCCSTSTSTSIASEVNYNSELQHLSLDLMGRTSFEIPKENVGKLRTLFLTENLPINIAKVKCIRALSLERYDMKELRSSIQENRKLMPMMIGKLTALQTLPYFVVGEDKGHKIEELGSLSKLRGKLMIYNLERVKGREEAEKANISGKPNTHELGFCWDSPSTAEDTNRINHQDVLEGLKPHGNLKVFKLKKFEGQSFASWMMSGRDAQLLQNLVKIEISECTRCEQVPPLGNLPHLEVIRMFGLRNLKRIGPEFYGCHSVVNHDHDNHGFISGSCSGTATTATATKAPIIVFPALRELYLDDMPDIEEWSGLRVSSSSSDTIIIFPLLEWLFIRNCPELTKIPSHLLSSQELIIGQTEVLLVDLLEKSGKILTKLTLCNLEELCYLPNNFQNLVSLGDLTIANCPNLRCIIEEIEEEEEASNCSGLTSLQRLRISHCEELTCLPKGLLQQTLVTLEIEECRKLIIEETEEETSNCSGLTSLQRLCILSCTNLTCLPKRLLQQTLITLVINGCPNLIIADPDELCSLPSLQKLQICECPRLVGWWDKRLFCLTSLQTLDIGRFSEELEYFPWPSTTVSAASEKVDDDDTKYHPNPKHYPFISLVSLTLHGWKKLKYLPDQLQHLTTLRHLSMSNIHGMEALPEWLGNLSSLYSLELVCCMDLMNLPTMEAMQRLTNLHYLTIYNYCPYSKNPHGEDLKVTRFINLSVLPQIAMLPDLFYKEEFQFFFKCKMLDLLPASSTINKCSPLIINVGRRGYEAK